jgi:hypothetical protein
MKIISLFILSFLLFQISSHASEQSLGNGSASNPFKIYNLNDLHNISLHPDAHFELAADIDASAEPRFRPLFIGDNAFTGSLNGQGHTISHISIDQPHVNNTALISVCNECEIKNLNLKDVSVVGGDYSAALVGRYIIATSSTEIDKTAQISNITVSGNVIGGYSVGGVLGNVYHVSTVLSEDTFTALGVKFEGSVYSTFLSTHALWMCGTFDYD